MCTLSILHNLSLYSNNLLCSFIFSILDVNQTFIQKIVGKISDIKRSFYHKVLSFLELLVQSSSTKTAMWNILVVKLPVRKNYCKQKAELIIFLRSGKA